MSVTPLPVPHGAVSTLGFLFSRGGRKLLAYLSDCAAVPEPVRAMIAGVDVLIIDGLRDKPHPTGGVSNDDAGSGVLGAQRALEDRRN